MVWRGIIVAIILCLIWQLLVWVLQVPSYLLPAPSTIIISLANNASLLAHETWPTIIETLLGLVLGCLFGALMAINMCLFKSFKMWSLPLIIVSQAVPTFAIAPLLVVWLGYGLLSKVVTCMIILFFPVTSSFHDGLESTPQGWLDLAHVNQASKWSCLWHIRIPAALPSLGTGLRMAAAWAPMGAIVGEWVGSNQGLGFLMIQSNARLDTPLLFSA